MADRKIYCNSCSIYVGTIRDASLMKNLKFVCSSCNERQIQRDKFKGQDTFSSDGSEDFNNIFNNIFNSKFK